MELKIEGYSVAQLEALGKEVDVVGGLEIGGNARKVGRVFLALGLFGDVVQALKKFAPAQEPISDELRLQGKLLGLSDEDMDEIRAGKTEPQFQTIMPSVKLPFGVVFPVGDTRERRNALLHFRMMIAAFGATIGAAYRAPGISESGDVLWEYWRVLHDFLSEKELEFVFDHPALIHLTQVEAEEE